MSNYAILKTMTLAALLGGSLTLVAYPADALAPAQADRPTTVAMTKQEQAPNPTPDPAEIAPVSEQELTQFASALMQLQTIQNAYDEQVVAVVQQEGLTPERFDQILMVARSPQEAEAENIPEVSEDEAASFERAVAQIGEIQNNARSEMQQAIQEEGLEIERFQEIIIAVNNDESLEERVRQIMESSSSSG